MDSLAASGTRVTSSVPGHVPQADAMLRIGVMWVLGLFISALVVPENAAQSMPYSQAQENISSAPGLGNASSFLTVQQTATTTAAPAAVEDDSTPMIGLVVGGFVGCLLFFALIALGLVGYVRCKGLQDTDKDVMVDSYSNDSWCGDTNDTYATSMGDVHRDPVNPSTKQPVKTLPGIAVKGGASESNTDSASP